MAWRRDLVWWFLVPLGGIVLVVATAFGVWVIATAGSVSFPRDGVASGSGPIYAGSVYESVRGVAGTSGAGGGCRWVGVRPPRFRCVVPGRGGSALTYRVTVSRADSCWHARGVGFQPLDGCIPAPAPAAD
jgi:hypothetical protein